jgi:hypothetical protein
MANIKFSAFTQKVVQTNVDFLVGYTGADNVRITPAALGDGIYLPLGGGTMVGNINFNDNVYARFGTGSDLDIGHDASNSYISHTGVGNLIIQNTEDNADIIFKSDDGAGGTATYFYLDGGVVDGVSTKGATRFPDSSKILMGDAMDLQLFHDATDSLIRNYTGDLIFTNYDNDKDIIFQSDDGSGGTATYFYLDGAFTKTIFSRDFWGFDNVKALFGTSADLEIYHDGSNSYVSDVGSGSLHLTGYNLQLQDNVGGKFLAATKNADVALYYADAKKLETTATGIQVTDEVSIGTSLVHTGDTDTKVTFGTNNITLITGGATHFIAESDQTTILYSGNAQTLFCDTNQRVGIGTATPAESLQIVNGDHFQLRLGTDATYYEFGRNYNTGALWIQGSQVGYNNIVLAPTSGDVGIGIAAPLFKLHTYRDDATATPSVTIENDGTGDASIHFLLSGVVGWSAGLDNSDGDAFKIHNSQGFSGSFFTIDSDGDVGIGEVSVDARLHISSKGGSGISNIKLESGGSSKWAFGIPASQTYLAFDETNDSLSTPTMVLTKTTKRVGIGTVAPTAALQVVGLVEYADNATAITAGLTAGAFYRTGDLLKVVH